MLAGRHWLVRSDMEAIHAMIDRAGNITVGIQEPTPRRIGCGLPMPRRLRERRNQPAVGGKSGKSGAGRLTAADCRGDSACGTKSAPVPLILTVLHFP
jgi:hypothetical protein